MTTPTDWWIEGSYFEACNCEAVCPCRQLGGRPGGSSTYGTCDFALSWHIKRGAADGSDLAGLDVVLAGSYEDDEPRSFWRVALYIDEHAERDQHAMLTDIFLGRAGGTTMENFAKAIDKVYAVRSARIRLDHTASDQRIHVGDHVIVRAMEPVDAGETVACGIPGYDHPGTEYRCSVMSVDDTPLQWKVTGRCGFATDFSYSSERSS